jgi:hypothetical protein
MCSKPSLFIFSPLDRNFGQLGVEVLRDGDANDLGRISGHQDEDMEALDAVINDDIGGRPDCWPGIVSGKGHELDEAS